MFRTIGVVELEPGGGVLDRINRPEKMGYIESAHDVRTIRRSKYHRA